MKTKILQTAAVALAVMGMSASASAATLNYDFTMQVVSMTDATEPGQAGGVFASQGFTSQSIITGHVWMDTKSNLDWQNNGDAVITIDGLSFKTSGSWAWSNSNVPQSGLTWEGATRAQGETLWINDNYKVTPSGQVTMNTFLTFSSPGVASSGYLEVRVNNGVNAMFRAEIKPGSSSTPELDPSSGSAALVLLLGGTTLALSSRSRRQGSRR